MIISERHSLCLRPSGSDARFSAPAVGSQRPLRGQQRRRSAPAHTIAQHSSLSVRLAGAPCHVSEGEIGLPGRVGAGGSHAEPEKFTELCPESGLHLVTNG